MTSRDLRDRLEAIGQPMNATGLSRIEHVERRVDVDEAMALAVALDLTPSALLLPPTARIGTEVAVTENVSTTERRAWLWAAGEIPLDEEADSEQRRRFQIENRPFADPPPSLSDDQKTEAILEAAEDVAELLQARATELGVPAKHLITFVAHFAERQSIAMPGEG